MKNFSLLTIFITLLTGNLHAQSILCEGLTNDVHASENAKFQLEIKKDKSPITKNFGPFYKSTIKFFYSTANSFTGADISTSVSTTINKIIFSGSLPQSRNLTFIFNPDDSIQSVVLNYDDKIINQSLQCESTSLLPARPVCSGPSDKNKDLYEAVQFAQNTDQIETALECGANVNQADKNGCTAMMFAVEPSCGKINSIQYSSPFRKTSKIIDALANHGAFVNVADAKGETPLIKAAKLAVPDVYETFIALEADFNAQDKNGNTALMHAARVGNEGVVEQLLDGDPDRALKNNAGLTAYDIAKKLGNDSVSDLIRIADASISIEGKDDGTCSPLQINIKQGQVIDLTLSATDKMFRLESKSLNLEIMAEIKSTSKKTISMTNKGTFKFTCGFHGANKLSEGIFIVD